VLHPVARENDAPAAIEAHRAADDERALGEPQALRDIGVDVRVRHRLVVLRNGRAVERGIPLQGLMKLFLVNARHRAVESTDPAG